MPVDLNLQVTVDTPFGLDHTLEVNVPMDIDSTARPIQPPRQAPKLAGVPHDKKWALLKDVLEPLFHEHKVQKIAQIMADQHHFKAK